VGEVNSPSFNMNQMLTEDNFLQYAMHHYDNSQCYSLEEFNDDLKRFLYLKKLFSRYKYEDDLKENLILNHLIVIYNIFGDNATNMLFFKVEKEYWNILVTFLVFLNRMPEELIQYNIKLSEIQLDDHIIQTLRKI
jgi:hypothetical protein